MIIEEELYRNRVIDNRNIEMTNVVRHFLKQPEIKHFSMAVGYFYISGLQLVKDEIIHFMDKKNGHIKILMGNETNHTTSKILTPSNETNYLNALPGKINEDTSTVNDDDFLKMINQWILEGRIEVKIYTGRANYFHAKSYLFSHEQKSFSGKAIVGSSNFSRNGLQGNTELNVLSEDNFYALRDWFYTLWDSDEVSPFSPELLKIIKNNVPALKNITLYKPVRETYYDFANIYGRPYTELNQHNDWVEMLYPHQQSGVIDIEDKLNTFNTAVLSDGVGLGKTRTTAGIIRLAADKEKELKTLIIADKKLKTQWGEELATVGISQDYYDYISREKFALMNVEELYLVSQKYHLIVIDEAHIGFKNRSTNAYRNLEYIKEQAQRTNRSIRGLLLTATPWNNSRRDVLNLGSLFLNVDNIPDDRTYKQYFLFANRKKAISKLENDNAAFNKFWEDLFLQRTRKTYGGKNVNFASRQFPAITIPYEPRKNAIFADNFERISELRFAYMDPMRYVTTERNQIGSDRLKMMLLKRADSSWKSYINSLKKIEENTTQFLRQLQILENSNHFLRDFKGYLGNKYDLTNYQATKIGLLRNFEEDTEADHIIAQFNIDSKNKQRLYFERITNQIDSITSKKAKTAIKNMMSDAHMDLSMLQLLIEAIDRAYAKRDEKFEKVYEVVLKELNKGHKVIVISQFQDTAKYYYNLFLKDKIIESNNLGLVTGNEKENRIGTHNESKKEILDRFSPISKNRNDIIKDEKEIHLLVGTDTISTGQNLQDAVVIMNLDLPYNPMILEQRIGRIDRPRSNDQVKDIYIYTFPVYDAIEAELKMTERLGIKMDGVLADTQFDDIVLPEYKDYLKRVKQDSGKAIEKMLDDTLKRTLYKEALISEKHSDLYKEANKRMYDIRISDFKHLPMKKYLNISFSKGINSHSIVVIKINYRDVNGANLFTENVIMDLDNLENNNITNAEKHLFNEISQSINTDLQLPINKAEKTIDDMRIIIDKLKYQLVEGYNAKSSLANENIDSLQDKIAQKAAAEIQDSVRNKANQQMIKSKVLSAGMEPKMIGVLAKNIGMIDPDDENYEIVKEIAADVNQFWLHFEEYAKIFDVKNIETSKGANVKKVDIRKANIETTNYEILLANLVVH